MQLICASLKLNSQATDNRPSGRSQHARGTLRDSGMRRKNDARPLARGVCGRRSGGLASLASSAPFRCDPFGGLSKPGAARTGPFLAFLSRPAPLDPFASPPSSPNAMLPAGSWRGCFLASHFCRGRQPCEAPESSGALKLPLLSGTPPGGPGSTVPAEPGPISPRADTVSGCTCAALCRQPEHVYATRAAAKWHGSG